MTDQEYTFNWHALSVHGDNDEAFLRWMIVNLVTFVNPDDPQRRQSQDVVNRLGEVSDNFTNVTLTIQANGIPLNASYFVSSVRRNMEWWAKKEALAELEHRTDVQELIDLVFSFKTIVGRKMERVAGALGIDLNEDGEVL